MSDFQKGLLALSVIGGTIGDLSDKTLVGLVTLGLTILPEISQIYNLGDIRTATNYIALKTVVCAVPYFIGKTFSPTKKIRLL